MAAIMSVLSGGVVVQMQRLQGVGSDMPVRLGAINGARYVLADDDAVASRVYAKRMGKNLLLEQHAELGGPFAVIVDDFFGSGAQLFGVGAEGEYLPYVAAIEAGTEQVSGEDNYALLTLASAEPATAVDAFQFVDGDAFGANAAFAGLAAVAGGIALSNDRSSSNKAAPVPIAGATSVLSDVVLAESAVAPVAVVAEPAAVADMRALDVYSTPESVVLDPVHSHSAVTLPSSENASLLAAIPAQLEEQTSPSIAVTQRAGFSADSVPMIDAVLDDQGAIQGNVENGGYTDDGRPQLTGQAEAGVLVHIYRNSELIGQVVAGANGQWSFTPKLPLADGRHVITILHEYLDGDVSDFSDPYVIFVDKSVPDAPLITGMLDDEGRITGAINDQTITDDNRPTIDGTAEAHATIIVYDKGKEIGRTTVDVDGNWRFTPETPLADGTHILSYSAVDRAGNSSERSDSFEFLVDTRPEKVNIYYAADDVGAVTGEVFNGGVTDDRNPALVGSATAGGIVSIYEGELLLGQVTADVDGTWQFTLPTALSEGQHTFHATVTLVAKGESERSKPFNLEVDLSAPNVPSIDQVWDDVGSIQGMVDNGKISDDDKPTLIGTADANSVVHIYDGGSLLGTVVVDAGGNWTYTPPFPLASGKHDFTVVASDKAGNTSGASDVFAIIVETVPPQQIATVTAIGNDSGFSANDYLTNDGSAGRLIQGTLSAELGELEVLQVSTDGGLTWITALVEGTNWTIQDQSRHYEDWAIETRVVNGAGLMGETQETLVSLDVAAPKPPTLVTISGTDVIVEFDNANVSVGDKVNINAGKHSSLYSLTAEDIAAGRATIANAAKDKLLIDFEKGQMGGVSVGPPNAIGWYNGYGSLNNGLLLSGGTATFTLPGSGFSSLSVNIGALDPNKYGYVEFYDDRGKVVGRDNSLSGAFTYQTIAFSAPLGQLIHSFKIVAPGDGAGIVVDDLRLYGLLGASIVDTAGNSSDVSYVGGTIAVIPHTQVVSADAEWYFSNNTGTVFSVDGDVISSGDAFNVQGGRGIDVLKLSGAGSVLDLEQFGGRIQSVEVFDIAGTGDNALKLGLADVLENGSVDVFYVSDKSRVQMMVKGDAGDKVELSDLLANGADYGSWLEVASVTIGGVVYGSYQHSSLGAELLVQQGVTVVLDNHVSGSSRFSVALELNINNVLSSAGQEIAPADYDAEVLVNGGAAAQPLLQGGVTHQAASISTELYADLHLRLENY